MGQLRRLVRYGQMSEQDASRAGLREAQDWYDALQVAGTILLAGLLIGLAWFIAVKGERAVDLDGQVMGQTKQERALQPGKAYVLSVEDHRNNAATGTLGA